MTKRALKWPPVHKETLEEMRVCNLVVPSDRTEYAVGDFVVFQTSDDVWELGEWEVDSIRFTSLSGVTNKEWEKAVFLDGPESAHDYYLRAYKRKVYYQNEVKVVKFRRLSTDLADLERYR